MSSSKSYWEERQKELNKKLQQDEKKLEERLKKRYAKEYAELDKDIARYYAKYGKDNVLEYRELLKELDPKDKELLYRSVETFAQKYPQWAHLAPTRESIYKLDRLQGLQTSIRIGQLEIGAENYSDFSAHLEKLAESGTSTAQVLGLNSYNKSVAKSFVDLDWADGEKFSERIWQNADDLAKSLTRDITNGIARGDSYQKLSAQLNKKFESGAKNAYRLVYTEGSFVLNESSIKQFEQDFEEYEFATAEDDDVCDICKGLNGQVFKISERQPGLNFPPMHPWCRCTFRIVVKDWERWIDEYARLKATKGIDDGGREGYNITVGDISTTEAYLKELFPSAEVSIEGLDPLAVESSFPGADLVLQQFPEIKDHVRTITKMDIKAPMASIDDAVYYGSAFRSVETVFEQMHGIAEQTLYGYPMHPQNSSPPQWLAHELGHQVIAIIISKTYKTEQEMAIAWETNTSARKIVDAAVKRMEKTEFWASKSLEEMIGSISGYALSDASEAIGEAFGDYAVNRMNASPVSIAIVEEARNTLDRLL